MGEIRELRSIETPSEISPKTCDPGATRGITKWNKAKSSCLTTISLT
jgi:hypothetical protein